MQRDKLPGGPGGTEPDFEATDSAGMLREIAFTARAALRRRKTLVDRAGEHDVPDSDERTVLSCIELKAKLVGLLGDGKNLSLDQLRTELDRLGYRLEPKGKLKAVKP